MTIPEGTTKIGPYAFAGIGELTSVTILASVTRVSSTAFQGCTSLRNVEVTDLDTLARLFPDSYSRIQTVTIPEGVTVLPDGMFEGCDALTSVTLPSTLVDIGGNDLRGLGEKLGKEGLWIQNGWVLGYYGDSPSALMIPEGVVGIGGGALADLYDLEVVTLPSTLKTIGAGAFAGDTYLDDVVIPDGVEVIDDGAFEDCSYMQTLTVGGGVRIVGDRAFAGCTKLAGVVFAEGLESIGAEAFAGNWRMQSVALPCSTEWVAWDAFAGCDSLTGVTTPTHGGTLGEWFEPVFGQIVDVAVPKGETVVCAGMFADCASLRRVRLPSGVTEIGDSAFENCTALDEVALPGTLATIGARAFAGCTALRALGIPADVEEMGEGVCEGCAALRDLTLSRRLTAIPAYAFAGCDALDSLVVPSTVTDLGAYFCPGRTTSIYYLGDAPGYDLEAYAGTSPRLVSYIVQGTKGWDGRPNSRDWPAQWPIEGAHHRNIQPWEAYQVEVTFDANGGSFASGAAYVCGQVTYTSYALPPYEPTRKGSKFAGYWTERGAGTRITSSTAVTLTKAHTLYAHWETAVTALIRFNANGGTVAPAQGEYVAGEPFGELPVPERTHYEFVGWYTDRAGGVAVRAGSEVPQADRELFARWRPKIYEIRFHAENGTEDTASQPYTYGETVTLRANRFRQDGYVFAGWARTPGGEAVYADRKTLDEVSAIADGVIHLYARWGVPVAVELEGVGAVELAGGFPYGEQLPALPEEAAPEDGLRFLGWATALDARRVVRPSDLVPEADEVTLYAVWGVPFDPWTEDGAFSGVAANVYDGYLVDADGAVAGTIQVKTAKQAVKKLTDKTTKEVTYVTNVAVTASVTVGGKKWSYAKGAVDGRADETGAVTATNLLCTAKGVPVAAFEVTLGRNGLSGAWGGCAIHGARNGMGVKGDAMMAALADYTGSWSVSVEGARLQLVVGAKGVVKIVGTTADGFKISASVQAAMGDGALYAPYVATLKSGKLTKDVALLVRIAADGSVELLAGTLGDETAVFSAGGRTEAPSFQDREEARTVYAGVAVEDALALQELGYPAKFAATKLPTGLKLDAARGVISGIPTKVGVYASVLKATGAANSKWVDQLTRTYTVEAMPEWAVGTFNGGSEMGSATFTVANTGKISGKWMSGGLTWTFSAAGFASYEDGIYMAEIVGKSGKLAVTNMIELAEDPEFPGRGCIRAWNDECSWAAWQNVWGREPWKTALEAYMGSWSVSVEGARLQLVVGAKGVVKIAGTTADGFKISASVQASLGDGVLYVPFVATLKSGKLTKDISLLARLDRDGWVELVFGTIAGEAVGLVAGGPTEAPVFQDRTEARTLYAGVLFEDALSLQELGYPAKFAATKLPPGLKLDAATGVISGIPTKVGVYTAILKATSTANSNEIDQLTRTYTVEAPPGRAAKTLNGGLDARLP
ncbi:MAG: leucine-rich repeat protein [Kiritimatiellia bacterium]